MTAAALVTTLSVSPCISWANPNSGILSYYQNLSDGMEMADFGELRDRWRILLVGENLDTSNSVVADYVASIEAAADIQWNALIKRGDGETDTRTCLFSDLPLTDKSTKTGSSQITLTFDRLKAIVLAYKTEGTSYYGSEEVWNEILSGLDYMTENHYSKYYACGGTGTSLGSGTNSFGNWYDWRIGTPRQLCDLLLMICDDLNEMAPGRVSQYVDIIMANNKKVDTTGANRTWIANIFIQCGVLLGDGSLIEAGKEGISDVFKYVSSGDGFYRDGSFIQHTNYAYTGGYGKALLCTLAPMMYVLNDTPYEISYEDNREQIFFDMIFEAYEPLIYGGRFMDMAREREISRVANQDNIPGRQAIRSIIMLKDVLPEEQSQRAESMLKEWLSDEEVLAQVCIDPIGGYNEYYLPGGVIADALEIVNSGTEPRGSLVKHKRYGSMDRVVHLRDDFGFTISMSSNRIKNTEGTNDEGLRLWNIGDGLTYLYNDDKNTYSDHYWATVDYHRLPGTTVNRVESRAPKAGYGTFNPYKFAGGTDLGEYGIAGMEMQGVGNTSRNGAHAKKSWFMFDDEIVAVGSDIRSTLDGSGVETIVENRKVALDKSNTLTVNGKEQAFDEGVATIEENKALKVTTVTNASGQDIKVKHQLDSGKNADSKVTFSSRIKMPATNDFFALKLYGQADGDSEEKNLLFLTMRNNAMVPRMSDGKDAYSKQAVLTADTWHEVKVELDLASQTLNYWFDGTQIIKGEVISGNTSDAELVDAPFFAGMQGENPRLTAFEIMTPGKGTGTILVDEVSVVCDGAELLAEDFEESQAGQLESSWQVTQNDKAEGAGASVLLEQTTIVENNYDEFNGVHEDTQWIHLAGSTDGSDVGYYFPGGASITGLRETRKGSWNLVNTYEKFRDDEERINSFVTFWFDHGQKPVNENYAYVILPGKSAAETESYNSSPDIEILRQDEKIHAVRETELGITGINFFEGGKFGAFQMEQPGSVMYQQNEDQEMTISFSDPTQTLKEISLTASLAIEEILEMDEEIAVTTVNGNTVFTAAADMDPRALGGKSYQVKVRLADQDNMFESAEEGTTPEHWTVESGNASVVVEDDENHALEIAGKAGEMAAASVALSQAENSDGEMITFMAKRVKGSGEIRLDNGSEKPLVIRICADSEQVSGADMALELEDGKWHEVKVKVNLQENKCYVLLDGKRYGEPMEFAGGFPEVFRIAAEAGGQIRLDNLIVREVSTEAPTRPGRLTYTGYGDTYVDLKWDASESENPIYYVVTVNGEDLEEQITEETYRVDGLEPEETYVFTVRAMDDDENCSEPSVELEVTLTETLNQAYVINFNGYKTGEADQYRWTFGGVDPLGTAGIYEVPKAKEAAEEGLTTDLEYWDLLPATPSNAEPATPSDAEPATPSNAAPADSETADRAVNRTATPSNAEPDQALYVYSGSPTSAYSKNATYDFDRQTKEQTYRMKLYFAPGECTNYMNINLVGSNGKQAVTMMIANGKIGYRAGDAPSTTKVLLNEVIEGEWIDLSFTADPETQTFSITANDETKENLKFRNETNDIVRLTVNGPGNAAGGFYVDDIVLPADEDFNKWILRELAEELEEELTVPYGTLFEDLRLPVSAEVIAEMPDGEETGLEVRINWEKGSYNPEKSGTYRIKGSLAYADNCISKISDNDIRMTVIVEKEIKYYGVTLVQSAGGTIEADAERVEAGDSVTVTAYPNDGYRLAGWLIDGKKKQASGDSYTFTPNGDVTVEALFEAEDVKPEGKYYTVTLLSNPKGGKIVSSTYYAKAGTEVLLTAVPDEGYTLKTLKVNGRTVEVDEDLTYSFTLERNTGVTAVFEKVKEAEEEESRGDRNDGGSSSDNTVARPSYAVDGTWSEKDGQWYLIGKDGVPMTGWVCTLWNGVYEWFLLGEDGAMKTGLQEVGGQMFYLWPNSDGRRGCMVTGWQQIDGVWRFFNPVSDGSRGAMLRASVTPDGYRVDENGVWIP